MKIILVSIISAIILIAMILSIPACTTSIPTTTEQHHGRIIGSSGGLPCYSCFSSTSVVYFWNVFIGHVEIYYSFNQTTHDTGMSLSEWNPTWSPRWS